MGSCWSIEESSDAERVLRVFRRNKIQYVSIDWRYLRHIIQRVDKFERAIQKNTSVMNLHLHVHTSTYLQMDGYVRILSALGGLQKLNNLYILFYGRPDQDCQAFLSIVQNIRKIRFLRLTFTSQRYHSRVVRDEDSDLNIQEQQAVRLQRACQGLVELQGLQIIYSSSRYHLAIFQELLSARRSLQRLSICGEPDSTSFSPSTMMTQILSIREVQLDNFYFDESCCLAMASALANDSSPVKKLTFSSCDFDNHTAVFHGIGQSSSLETLEILYDYRRTWNDCLFECLGQLLATNDALTELVLCLFMENPPLAPMLSGLTTNGTLRKLIISASGFKGTFCEELGSALAYNSGLQEVMVSGGSMTCKDFSELLQFMPTNQTLKAISLTGQGHNEGTSEVSLPDNYEQNFVLEEILIPPERNGWCNDMLRVILMLNKAGRSYLLTDAGSRTKGVEVLIKVKDNLDCLFTHLVENPSLCDIVHTEPETRAGRRLINVLLRKLKAKAA